MMRARQSTAPHEPAPAKPAPAVLPSVSNQAVARLATSFSPGVDPVGHEADPGDASIARGLAAAVRRRSGEPVLQRAFLVSSTVAAKDESEFTAADLTVDAVHLTEKKRPPTAIAGSQGRHTLAWAARTRYWQTAFTGKTYLQAFAALKKLALSDATVDKAMGSTAADRARQALLSALDGITDTTSKAASKWIETLTWALTTYIKTSQTSSATAFPSKRPKGRNESGHLATLQLANDAYRRDKKEGDLDVDPPAAADIKAAARGLVDLHGGLKEIVLWKVFNDWLEMLTVVFPNVIFAAKIIKLPKVASVNALKTEGYPAVAKLYKEMGIDDVLEKDAKATATKEKATDEAEAEAEVSAMTGAGGAQQLAEAEPFLVRVPTSISAGAEDTYEAKDLNVDRLVVSDERPPTKFGKDQKSHTIPWSLDRIVWIKELSGKPLSDVIAVLHQRASSEKAWSAKYMKADVKKQRDDLLKDLDDAMGAEKSIPGWTRWLDARIEDYVRTYEASAFATYATEVTETGASTAASKGEGAGLRAFRRIEQQLADDATAGTVRTPDEVKARGAEVRRYGAMLIDVPKLSHNVGPVDPPKLLKRWLEDLKIVFPKVVAAHPLELDLAFADAGVVTAFHREQDRIVSSTERSVRDSTKKRREGTSTEDGKKAKTYY
jgi:hypothetical protein